MTKRQKTKNKDQRESLILWCQGSFALLRCFQLKWSLSWSSSPLFLPLHLRATKIQLKLGTHGTFRFVSIWWVPFACRPLKYVLGLWGWLKSHRISFWAALGAVYKWLLVVFDGSWNLRVVKMYSSFSFLLPWDFPYRHPFLFAYHTRSLRGYQLSGYLDSTVDMMSWGQ